MGIRFTHQSGHGALLRAYATYWSIGFATAGGGAFELAYLYDVRLSGDLRGGVSLVPFVGLLVGSTQEAAGHVSVGPSLGGGVTFRHYGFTAGIDVNGGVYVSPRPSDDAIVEGSVSVHARFGFGLY